MAKIELPDGFKVMNPEPLDYWQGPYFGLSESQAKAAAVAAIPSAVRYVTMEVRLIVAGAAKNFWFENGIADSDLVERYLVDDPELRQDVARKLDVFEVDTFADLQEFIQGHADRCVIFVLSDEEYGGLPRLHAYTGSELVQFVTYSE